MRQLLSTSLFSLGFVVGIQGAPCDRSRPIDFRLKTELPDFRRKGSMTPEVESLINKVAFRPLVPETVSTSRFFKSAEIAGLRKHRLHLYQRVSPTDYGDLCPEDIVKELQKNPLVDWAAQEPVVAPANSVPEQVRAATGQIPDYLNCSSLTLRQCQRWIHEPTPDSTYRIGGVNAINAQKLAANLGGQVRIVQVEIDRWDTDHVDLPPAFQIFDSAPVGSHATESAGLMVGLSNGFGVKGVVPEAQLGYTKYSASALVDLRNYLKAGDVIQLGVHYSVDNSLSFCPDHNAECYVPVEYNSAVRDAIAYLVNEKGIHVILAAGNGSLDVEHPDITGDDTGAIYAGACSPAGGNIAWFSNYGERVKLHSWGEEVTTTFWAEGRHDLFVADFSGTSSANPILAGCAAFIQSVARARGIGDLPPQQMRQILIDSGRPVPNPTAGKNIGNQPDLVEALRILDELYPSAGDSTTTTTTTAAPTCLCQCPCEGDPTLAPPPVPTTAPTTTTTTTPASGSCGGIPAWSSTKIYSVYSEKVSYGGLIYEQRFYNTNMRPDLNNNVYGQPWQQTASC